MCLVLAGIPCSCSDDAAVVIQPSGPAEVMQFSPHMAPVQSSRALVADAAHLQSNCTPNGTSPDAAGDTSERIGIWADTHSKVDGTHNEIFKDVTLAYYEKNGGRPGAQWNYIGDDIYWPHGATMICRAYYPAKQLYENGMVEESSNATSFRLTYSTVSCQQDVLLGYNEVDCDTKQSLIDGADVSKNIPLKLKHAMAALQFKFVNKNNGDTDKLVSCWLESESTKDYEFNYATVGLMSYGQPASGAGMYKENQIVWSKAYHPAPGEKCHYWKAAAGYELPYNATQSCTAYTSKQSEAGSLFTDNEGYLLVVPQAIPHHLYLCFTTTYTSEDNVMRVRIPVDRGGTTMPDPTDHSREMEYDNPYFDKSKPEDAVANPKRIKKQFWSENHKYIYNITISESNVTLEIKTSEWNIIDSNTSIDF